MKGGGKGYSHEDNWERDRLGRVREMERLEKEGRKTPSFVTLITSTISRLYKLRLRWLDVGISTPFPSPFSRPSLLPPLDLPPKRGLFDIPSHVVLHHLLPFLRVCDVRSMVTAVKDITR
ncbi:hypothetical protein TrRE_jg1073 [Triparma retinervis]|uniref:Uncharacterized protein n=1 Tax=Triparma retinervis TaxID=2557542 RepID=A0A9W7DT70_9STRA|nr:hypothetical protein TrRE_jg1073 [Triparma retinervis]